MEHTLGVHAVVVAGIVWFATGVRRRGGAVRARRYLWCTAQRSIVPVVWCAAVSGVLHLVAVNRAHGDTGRFAVGAFTVASALCALWPVATSWRWRGVGRDVSETVVHLVDAATTTDTYGAAVYLPYIVFDAMNAPRALPGSRAVPVLRAPVAERAETRSVLVRGAVHVGLEAVVYVDGRWERTRPVVDGGLDWLGTAERT